MRVAAVRPAVVVAATTVTRASTELVLLVWVLGLFTAFSLATLKRGALSDDRRSRHRTDDRVFLSSVQLIVGWLTNHVAVLRLFLVVLALVFIGGMFFGAAPLRRRWLAGLRSGHVSAVHRDYGFLGGALLYAAITSRLQPPCVWSACLPAAYVVLVVNYVFPLRLMRPLRRKATEATFKSRGEGSRTRHVPLHSRLAQNEDAVYYLKQDTVVRDLPDEGTPYITPCEHRGPSGSFSEESHMVSLQKQAGLVVETLSGVPATRPQASVSAVHPT